MKPYTPDIGYTILKNGNLKFWIVPGSEAHHQLNELLDEDTTFAMKWATFVEPWTANGYFETMAPEWIGALTDDDACIIATDTDWPDDAAHPSLSATSKVWWFPDYLVRCPLEGLCRNGEVVLTSANHS